MLVENGIGKKLSHFSNGTFLLLLASGHILIGIVGTWNMVALNFSGYQTRGIAQHQPPPLFQGYTRAPNITMENTSVGTALFCSD